MKYHAFDKLKLKKGESKYKYVYPYQITEGEIIYHASIPKYKWNKYFESEKIAAMNVDKILISKGKEPLNILKKIVVTILLIFTISCSAEDETTYDSEFSSTDRYTYQFETNAPQVAYMSLRTLRYEGSANKERHRFKQDINSGWVSFEQREFFNRIVFDTIQDRINKKNSFNYSIRIYEKDNKLKIKKLLAEKTQGCHIYTINGFCGYAITYEYDKSHTMQFGNN